MSHETKSHENGKSPDKLIYMANQIGKFWTSQGAEKAPPAIAEHIKKFWDPRMRSAILAHLANGGVGLDPPVRAAIEHLAMAQRAN
jgi:formate dehydrogenase subunit delta